MKGRIFLLIGTSVSWWLGLLPAAAAEGEILTTVYSTAYNGYVRAPGPDGSFAPDDPLHLGAGNGPALLIQDSGQVFVLGHPPAAKVDQTVRLEDLQNRLGLEVQPVRERLFNADQPGDEDF